MGEINSLCWCERTEIRIPVEWLREGRTGNCDRPDCLPGCEAHDAEDDYYDLPPIKPGARRFNMAKFDPRKYDLRVDCSVGFESTTSLTLVSDPGLCPCGCAQHARSTFVMGHDQRMRGKLIRAGTLHAPVHRISAEGVLLQSLEVLDYAVWFSTVKVDWKVEVGNSIDRILGRTTKPKAEPERVRRAA